MVESSPSSLKLTYLFDISNILTCASSVPIYKEDCLIVWTARFESNNRWTHSLCNERLFAIKEIGILKLTDNILPFWPLKTENFDVLKPMKFCFRALIYSSQIPYVNFAAS